MNLVLKANDGRWAEAMITSGEIPEDTAQRWADASCETLGLPIGSFTPVFFEEGAPDPRTGVLLAEPTPEPPPPPAPPPPTFEELVAQASTFAELKRLVAENLA